MSSFSKITVTGLRAGWIQARKELIEHLIKVRFDMGSSPLVHYVLADMISSGELDKHISKMRSLYKEKCLSLVGSLTKHCSDYLNFEVPDGGFFLWINSNSISSEKIVEASRKEGLLFPPGNIFPTEPCAFLIKSSMFGGCRLCPDPFPSPLPCPPPPGGDPHGESFLNILPSFDMTLYIVTF